MSVFNFPRIHFNGVMRVNVGTGNNDDYSSSDPGSSNNYLFRESPCPHLSGSACPHLRTFDSKKVELNSCLEEKFSSPLDLIEWMKKNQDEFKHQSPSNSGNYVDASVTPAYWNYFGSMSMWSDNVRITGLTFSPGNYVSVGQTTSSDFARRLLGDSKKYGSFSYFRWPHPPNDGIIPGDNKELGDVKTTAVMTDVKSEGSSPGSQIFADNLLLRDADGKPIFYRKLTDGSYTGSGSKPTKASATRLDAGGNAYECFYAGVYEKDGSQSMVINPGGAAVFQCVMPFSDDFVGDPAYMSFLSDNIDSRLGQPKGILVRYTMSAGIHPLNNSEEWAALYAQDAKTSFFNMLNERQCPVAGTIAPWYGEEQDPAMPDYDSITVGREISMAPMLAQKTVGWTDAPLGGHLPQSLSPIICRLQDYQSSASPTAQHVFSIDVSKALTSYFTQVGGKLSLYVGKNAADPSPVLICDDLPYGNPANDHYIDVSTGKISADPSTTVFDTPLRGMVDVILEDPLYAVLSNANPEYPNGGTLIVKTDSSDFFTMVPQKTGPPTFSPTSILFSEAPYGIVNNKRTLYTEQVITSGQSTTVSTFRYNGDDLTESVFQIIHRGKVLTELPDPSVQKFYMLSCATIPLPDAYKNTVTKSLITCMDELRVVADVREPGSFRFAVVTEEQAMGISTFQDLNNSPMVVAQVRVLPNEDYSNYFVDPSAAEPVGNENLTFEVIYDHVFKPYHVLYPAMDQVRSLYDPEQWGGVDSARRLLGRLETKTFGDSSYMPRTRDLSASRRQLIQAWCRKTINAAQQATLLLLLVLGLSSCRTEKGDNNVTPEEMISVGTTASNSDSQSVPYTLSVEPVAKLTTGFQSYTFATYDDFWVVLGGRTNGFHGTEGQDATFPSAQSNDSIYVIDSRTLDSPEVKIYSSILPERFRASLSSTNMGFEQTEGYLYTIGGYGSSCTGQDGTDSCYQTFPYLTRISLGELVRSVVQKDPIDELIFHQIENENFRVTGGEMHMINDTFYVVFGQNYPGMYKPGLTGEYTEKIRTFKIVATDSGFEITDQNEISAPDGSSGANSEFHRRDLNVVPAARGNGRIGLDVYGGVFNASDLAFTHPITINGLTAEVKETELKVGLYECGQVLLYDRTANKMYTSLLGGIGGYQYRNDSLITDPEQPLPFTRTISTITHDNVSGIITEYIQPFKQSLPSWIGANAVFIPASNISTLSGFPEIIDFNTLSGDGPIVIGHMIGGIHANGPQTAGPVGSYADNNVYAVTLRR
ncbi:hypothetical protein CEQ90_11525 [Lewinellaceae bacterium SD302]|nr:hypothetical protein CEQ90_11525 [Lewinellaceae bacterium SD302]